MLFLCADLLLVACFAGGVFLYTQHRLLKAFDLSLRSSAEALATLTESDDENGAIELEFSDEIMSRFSRNKAPDLFAVFGPNGKLVEASRSLTQNPDWIGKDGATQVRDFTIGKEPYRGLNYHTVMELGREGDEHTAAITVFFASSREDLNDDIEDMFVFLISIGLAVSLVSIGGVVIILYAGLKPLRRLARQAEKMKADRLDGRFDPARLPTDLVPFATAFNDLLARIEDAFSRERQFSADAAHELRTPLATMKSGVQAALISPEDSSGARDVLEALLEDIERLEALCEALLLANRAGVESDATMSSGDVVEDVRSATEGLQRLYPSRTIEFHEEVHGKELLLHASSDSVRRVVTNLVDNAIRYAGESARVDVWVKCDGEAEFSLRVRDNGPGIPSSVRPNLFKRLSRGDASRSRASGGFGLGLAICRSLVASHHGKIELVSPEGPGCEIRWTFAFPCDPEEESE